MLSSTDSSQNTPEIRARIEELATELVVRDPASISTDEFTSKLADIAHRAGAAGRADAAEIATSLAQLIHTEGIGEGEAISRGLIRLQEAISAGDSPEFPPLNAAPAAMGIADDPELVADFVTESREHLGSIESQLLTLERDPTNAEAMNAVFRGFHTIKGLAGFLELSLVRDVAHEVETVLDMARTGKLAITPAVIDVVLAGADYLAQSVDRIAGGVKETQATAAHQVLLERIRRVQTETEEAAITPSEAIILEPEALTSAAVMSQPTPQRAASDGEMSTLRVPVPKLDFLVDMVGEMVIAQSLLRHDPALAALPSPQVQRNLAQLLRITGEVQRTAMAMRMIPIGQLFSRTTRLVRDLSRKIAKPIEVETSGEETELDKTIAEELTDPLMHMVRNSVDHGIEPPEVRQASGKHPVGKIRLSAHHQGGQIIIQVADDGRGLDREKLLSKAREKGLITDGDQLTDSEVYNLIFHPGFSTAEKVTDVSGRGVGMDVVRKHVQKLRGRIEIESKRGEGTTFTVRLPLTLAIIDGLVVGVGGERFIIPIFAVAEMIRPAEDQVFTVEGRREMTTVRGQLLPIVRLHECFHLQPRFTKVHDALLIVGETSNAMRFCLMVDDLIGKQEVVIKSLGETLRNIPGVAGGAILGDGRVGLIVDMDAIYGRQSHV